MASNIISDTIDATYPVAGVDNDTQGFRDNFSIIKTGLNTANSEKSRLQTKFWYVPTRVGVGPGQLNCGRKVCTWYAEGF